MHLSCVCLILACRLELSVMRLLFAVELFWSSCMVIIGILLNFLANDSPVLSAITQPLIENLLL